MPSMMIPAGLMMHRPAPPPPVVFDIHTASTIQELEKALEKGEAIDQTNHEGHTALMIACKRGNFEVVDFLLDHGANPNSSGQNHNKSPLTIASSEGFSRIAERLVQAGAEINSKKDGSTALYFACVAGNIDVIEKLLELGAETEVSTLIGCTPLMWACTQGNVDVVDRLLKGGAKVNACSVDGSTAFLWACEGGQLGIIDRMVIYGADIHRSNKHGVSPLLTAVRQGHVEAVDRLLSLGCDVNSCDLNHETVLMHACMMGKVEIVKLLLGSSPDLKMENWEGKTVLDLDLSPEIQTLLQGLFASRF